MWSKRLIKMGVVAVVVVGIAVLALTVLTETSEAQGPGGGRGRGQGAGIGARSGTAQGTSGRYGSVAGNTSQAMNRAQANAMLADLPPAVPGELPDAVVEALHEAIQDEYHAYATYQAVIDAFGAVRPFTSIQAAEAKHIDALAFLFERYGLPVPAAEPLDAVPQFASIADACATGAAAEIANFGLYDRWIATVQDYPDITQVFMALRDASEYQHLPAFERCAG